MHKYAKYLLLDYSVELFAGDRSFVLCDFSSKQGDHLAIAEDQF